MRIVCEVYEWCLSFFEGLIDRGVFWGGERDGKIFDGFLRGLDGL